MRRTKESKGITLIALITTIVVLLIIAGVAVTSITKYNIIENANAAVQKYGNKVEIENTLLSNYNSILDQYITSSTGKGEIYTKYSVGTIVTIGEEEFYVIVDSPKTEETLILLAKECIDTNTLKQSANNIQKPDYETARMYSNKYGLEFETKGRLITNEEAMYLRDNYPNILFGTETVNGKLDYWIGFRYSNVSNCILSGYYQGIEFDYTDLCGVRPVIEISKTKLDV